MLRRINGGALDPLTAMRGEMDRLFGELGRRVTDNYFTFQPVFPALNVWDEGEALMVEAELPGVQADNLEILTAGNELTIKGRRPELEDEKRTYHRRERGTGEFTRVITLPLEVDADKVDASMHSGVLTIRLPKAETARPRQITVKAG
jgi:HSP20 family protein